jgi:steroid delta-isomerase-like uncharacterized protein
MSIDANKTIIGRFFEEVFNQQSRRAAAELIDPALVVHHPLLPGGAGGVQDVVQMMGEFRRAFPDLSYAVDDLVGEHDKVAARWTARGTHRGDFKGVPATDRAVTVAGTDIFVIANGRIVETWVSSDLLGLMRQIGAIT